MKPTVYIYGSGDYHNYVEALTAAGAAPFTEVDGVDPLSCRALLLPGGGDIHGSLPPEETAVIRAYIDAGRPILGVCRGMQALNVYFGGTLFDDIPGHRIAVGDAIHPTEACGLVADLLGQAPVVNSNHHQAVDRLGDGLTICQRAADGTVEAFVHDAYPILGVQWHPERQSFGRVRGDAADAAPIFRWLLHLAEAE